MDDIGQIGHVCHSRTIGYKKNGSSWLCETVEGLIIVNSLLRLFSVTSLGRRAKNKKLKILSPACSSLFSGLQPASFHPPSVCPLTLFAGLCFCVGEYGRLKICRHRPGQVARATPTNSCMNTERMDADLSQQVRSSAAAMRRKNAWL